MPINVLFLAETNLSPSIAEQRALCEREGDLLVDAGQVSFLDLPRKLAHEGYELTRGDKIKIYDFACLPINTMTLVRMMVKVLRKGVAIEFCAPGITILPDEDNGQLFRLIAALDNHWRRVHGMKTHAGESKPGRKPRFTAEQLPEIRQLLAQEGATVASVAKDLGVGRTTLFDFLQRHSVGTTTK